MLTVDRLAAFHPIKCPYGDNLILFYTEVIRLFCVRHQDKFCCFEKGAGRELHDCSTTIAVDIYEIQETER